MESENEMWLLIRIADPVGGMFSSPSTHGRNRSFSQGPSTTSFKIQ